MGSPAYITPEPIAFVPSALHRREKSHLITAVVMEFVAAVVLAVAEAGRRSQEFDQAGLQAEMAVGLLVASGSD